MAAKAKYSKKLFENLDRAEVRKLAIVGMKLAPAKAYTMDFKTLVSWVYDRATVVPDDEKNGDRDRDPRPFIEVDLAAVGNEAFRDGVMSYIEKLQAFVQGNVKSAPNWPPANVVIDTPEEVVAEPVKKAAPKKAAEKTEAVEAPKRKRGRPRKNPVSVTEDTAPVAKAEPAKPEKKKIKKAQMGSKSTSSNKAAVTTSTSNDAMIAELTKTVQLLVTNVEELNTKVTNMTAFTDGLANGIKDGFEQLSDQIVAVREEQTAANNLLGNALLFLMNSVVFEEGEEKADLAGVPEPNAYLDLE